MVECSRGKLFAVGFEILRMLSLQIYCQYVYNDYFSSRDCLYRSSKSLSYVQVF